MALIKSDRVKETSTSTGNGTFSLAGATTGYRTFASVCVVGDTFFYGISNQTSGEWETGLGTYSATNTLTRTTVHASSNSGVIVTFGAGTKEVFLTASARYLERIVDNGLLTSTGSSTSIVAVNDGPQPQLDLAFSTDKTLTARFGPTPSYSRASTGTYFNASGVLTSAAINAPRFDHVYENGVWVSKGLLIEEQRTNLCYYSEDFSNAAWVKVRMSVTANNAVAPDGTTTADLIYPNTTGAYSNIGITLAAVTNSAKYTTTVYLKSAGKSWADVTPVNGSYGVWFNLSNGTVGTAHPNSTGTIQNVGNGWYRCSVTTTTVNTAGYVYVGVSDADGSDAVTASGTNGILAWGSQLELGSFATSYIPSLSNSSTVRSADVCQITGSDFGGIWNPNESSFAVEYDLVSTIPNPAIFYANDGTVSNSFRLYGSPATEFYSRTAAVTDGTIVLASTSPSYAKIAAGQKLNDMAGSLNGAAVVTDTSVAMPSGINRLDFGIDHVGTRMNGHIYRFRYFNSRLANQTLVQLSGGINNLSYKTVTGSGNATVTNNYTNINVSVPNPLPLTNGGTGATSSLAAVNNLVGNPPNDGGQYTLASKKTSGTPTFYWVDSTGYAPTLDLLFAADKSLTAYKGPTPSFSRASSGTYFGSDGLLKYAPLNLMTYSEDFSNAAWIKSGTSISADSAIAPDGTMTADKMVENTANIYHQVYDNGWTPTSGQQITLSIYAKYSGRQFVQFYTSGGFGAGSNAYANFDIINGIAGTVSGTGITSAITSVGNGWYRCSITQSSATASTSYFQFGIIPALTSVQGTSYVGDGISGVLIWGAMRENAASAGTYVKTTNSANSAPRFDHTYNGTSWISKGLLVEEQRTNTATYSEDFSNGSWIKTTATISANSSTTPDGTTTADLCYPTSTGTFRGFYKSFSSASVATTIFAKSAGKTTFAFIASDGNSVGASFNLSNGTVSNVFSGHTATITPVGNGWYRCSLSATTTVLQVCIQDSQGTSGTVTANSTDGILFWGAQVETGAFPTSYIPTTTAAVTRSADVCQITGTDFSGFYNQTEGSFVAEYDVFNTTILNFISQIDDSTNTNRFYFTGSRATGLNGFSIIGSVAGGNDFSVATVTANSLTKIAVGLKAQNYQAYSGSSSVSDSIQGLPNATLNRMQIGQRTGDFYLNGHISRLRYYPARIPNTALQTLST